MNIEPVLFFAMAFSIIIFSVVLSVIAFYLSNKHKVSSNNENLLEETRKKALKIIDDANSKAIDILNKATLSSGNAEENFNEEIKRLTSSQIKEFEKATSDFIKTYNQTLSDLKTKNIEVFQNVSKDIEETASLETESFKSNMEKLTVLSQKAVKERIDKDYESIRQEVENYKKEEMKVFEDKIYGLLEKVAKLTFGKTISLSEHENLIEEALEKAKKEGVFS